MSDVGLIAIIVAFFGLAIWLVRPLGRLIDSGSDSSDGTGDGQAEEPPDTGVSPTVIDAVADSKRPR